MSKIAEHKALEVYPMDEYEFDKAKKSNIERSRYAYIKGYNQAMQDVLEKAEKWIEKHIEMFSWVHCDSDGNEEWRNDFKNYMQNES